MKAERPRKFLDYAPYFVLIFFSSFVVAVLVICASRKRSIRGVAAIN